MIEMLDANAAADVAKASANRTTGQQQHVCLLRLASGQPCSLMTIDIYFIDGGSLVHCNLNTNLLSIPNNVEIKSAMGNCGSSTNCEQCYAQSISKICTNEIDVDPDIAGYGVSCLKAIFYMHSTLTIQDPDRLLL